MNLVRRTYYFCELVMLSSVFNDNTRHADCVDGGECRIVYLQGIGKDFSNQPIEH